MDIVFVFISTEEKTFRVPLTPAYTGAAAALQVSPGREAECGVEGVLVGVRRRAFGWRSVLGGRCRGGVIRGSRIKMQIVNR
jgi:hypothetical protein